MTLILAFVAFFRTPRNERFSLSKPRNMENDPEFAPEYTKKERAGLLVKNLLWFTPFIAFCELWFFDWLGEYVTVAHCYQYGPVTGTHLIIFGTLFGLPLIFAVVLFCSEGVKAIEVIKVGQFPLPGQKVLKTTKYKYGKAARIHGAILIAMVVFLLGFSVWGFMQAKQITQDIKPCESKLISSQF